MTDMSTVIIPKSDQLNADDLISGPRTVTITSVSVRPGTEQPVAISFEGDGGKPYKPCKSMCRVMVAMWGPDAKEYAGRSLALYRDPDVTWAGMKVGGIRISHMSHIERDHVMALTESKHSRKPFTVKPLRAQQQPPAAPPASPTATTAVRQPEDPIHDEMAALEPDEWKQAQGRVEAGRQAEMLPAKDAAPLPESEARAAYQRINDALRQHGDDIENLKATWDLNEALIKRLPDVGQKKLEAVFDQEVAKLEAK